MGDISEVARYGPEPNHRTAPVQWVRWARLRYGSAIPPERRAHITISPAVLKQPNGELLKYVSVNGYEHLIPEAIEDIRGSAEVAHDGYNDNGELIISQPKNKHAEIRMKEHAKREGMSIIAIGATNSVCDPCRDILDEANIPIVTKIRNPDVRPYWRPPDGVTMPDRSYLPPMLRQAREAQDAREVRARIEADIDSPPPEPPRHDKPRPPAKQPPPSRIKPPNPPPIQGRKHGPRR